jgi:hypothetical protein
MATNLALSCVVSGRRKARCPKEVTKLVMQAVSSPPVVAQPSRGVGDDGRRDRLGRGLVAVPGALIDGTGAVGREHRRRLSVETDELSNRVVVFDVSESRELRSRRDAGDALRRDRAAAAPR